MAKRRQQSDRKQNREAVAQRQRDWAHFCQNCGAAQTSADRDAAQCTNCHQPSGGPDIFFERIQMPGFPQIIVTRLFVYNFLKGCGWPLIGKGFDTADFWAFGPHRKVVDFPLTDERMRDRLLKRVRRSYLREKKAA